MNKRDAILKNMEHTKNIHKKYWRDTEFIQNQYNQGYVDFIALQSAKRNYLSSQTNLIKLNQSLIALDKFCIYKALGGRWGQRISRNEIEKL